jgi:hypothetical protein
LKRRYNDRPSFKRGNSILLMMGAALLSAAPASARGNPAQGPASTPGRSANAAPSTPSIATRAAGWKRNDGFLPFYWDQKGGELFLEVGRWDENFLYLPAVARGLGEITLQSGRAMPGMYKEAVVRFTRAGPRVLLVQTNTKFRALQTDNQALVRSVEESFPESVLASFPIAAEENGKVLIDATEFFLQDMFGIRKKLLENQQGDFRADRSRSAIYLPRTKIFPRNLEVEAILTFSSENAGPLVAQNTPDPRSMTVYTHHSLVALPEPGYRPREFDPRVGAFPVVFNDYARPFQEPLERRWINRWRLEKQDPGAALSPPKKPLVYYLDRAVPEPLRTALRQGALWWNHAFEAAGFKNAFEVRDLPEDADPLDARYSVIEWTHNSEVGFAGGGFLVDPRTGEIIKAVIRMNSDRSRDDWTYWSELLNVAGSSKEEFILARLRQLAAHETGHTLGLQHNFIASTYDRGSVMDYPAPLVRVVNGKIDLSDAYRQDVGEYDRFAIRYSYSVFSKGEDHEALQAIVQDGVKKGLTFIQSADGAFNPLVNPWDNGPDPVESFRQALEVRSILMNSFGEHALRDGEPMALLRERFWPVYLYHRFELDAAVKMVGGMLFTYAVKGDGQKPTELIAPERQREALRLLLETLQPEFLAVPSRLLPLFAPRPFGYSQPLEPFDQISTARTLAMIVVRPLLDRQRAVRLVAFQDRQKTPLTLHEVMEQMVKATWDTPTPGDPNLASLKRMTERLVVDGLIGLALDPDATPEVRSMTQWHLEKLAELIAERKGGDPVDQAHLWLAKRDIQQCLARGTSPPGLPKAPEPPAANLTSP